MRNLGMYQMAVAHAAMLVRDEGQAPYVELDAPLRCRHKQRERDTCSR